MHESKINHEKRTCWESVSWRAHVLPQQKSQQMSQLTSVWDIFYQLFWSFTLLETQERIQFLGQSSHRKMHFRDVLQNRGKRKKKVPNHQHPQVPRISLTAIAQNQFKSYLHANVYFVSILWLSVCLVSAQRAHRYFHQAADAGNSNAAAFLGKVCLSVCCEHPMNA